jgi:hypothetical protein
MFYESDITNLVTQWNDRASNPIYDDSYRKAVAECAYELNTALLKAFEEEVNAWEFLDEQYADEYLSSLEAHEPAA